MQCNPLFVKRPIQFCDCPRLELLPPALSLICFLPATGPGRLLVIYEALYLRCLKFPPGLSYQVGARFQAQGRKDTLDPRIEPARMRFSTGYLLN